MENEEVYNEAKVFLEEVKSVIQEAKKQGKDLVYASEDLLILELKDDLHTVYEVLNRNKNEFASKLIYIGDKKLRASYLLSLIHKQEIKVDPYYEKRI